MKAFALDRARVLAPGTVAHYARALKLWARSLEAFPAVEDFSRDMLRAFWDWLRQPTTSLHGKVARSEDTARKNVEVLQLFWHWCFDEDVTGTVAAPRDLEMPRQPLPKAKAPTWAEMDACIAACNIEWHRRATIFMRCTGLRAQQVMMAEWKDVDLDALTLHVTTGKSAQEKRGRVVPISKHFADELAKWGERVGFIIPSPRQKGARERQLRARDIGRAWARALIRDEVWKKRPDHAFRKGFVSGLKRLGADPDTVEVLVGHSLGLRGVYTDADAMPLREVVDLVPPLATNVVQLRKVAV